MPFRIVMIYIPHWLDSMVKEDLNFYKIEKFTFHTG